MTDNLNSKPITYMKTNSSSLVNLVNKDHIPIVITQNGENRAVIQSFQEFKKQRELLAALKILAIGETEIQQGKFADQSSVFASLKSKLKV